MTHTERRIRRSARTQDDAFVEVHAQNGTFFEVHAQNDASVDVHAQNDTSVDLHLLISRIMSSNIHGSEEISESRT